jgi:hypothetical protein
MDEKPVESLTVADALAAKGWIVDRPVRVSGLLWVAGLFAYLATEESSTIGVLVNEPRLLDRLLACMPVAGGSMVAYSGRASVEGFLRSGTAMPMFPMQIHSVKSVIYQHDDWEPVRLEF